jgi:hypothetical protein
MRRALAAAFVLAGVAAGCGSSRHAAAIVTQPLPDASQAGFGE